MLKLTSAYAVSGSERAELAERLYLTGGAEDAARRCDLNTQFGKLDLGAELVRRTGLAPGQSIADIGCGCGQHLRTYAATVGESGRSLGVDFSAAAVKVAVKNGLTAVVARADAVPLANASLDALTCNYAIYYMPHLPEVLLEWVRLVKPAGPIVITGPASDSNAELYRFHLEAAGAHPSDADRIALGYVGTAVPPALSEAGLQLRELEVLHNPVMFPARPFLAYWRSTSLFLRTVPPESVDAVLRRGADLIQSYAGEVTVTKRITVLTARVSG